MSAQNSPVLQMLTETALVDHSMATKLIEGFYQGTDLAGLADTMAQDLDQAELLGWGEDGDYSLAYNKGEVKYYARLNFDKRGLNVSIERHA